MRRATNVWHMKELPAPHWVPMEFAAVLLRNMEPVPMERVNEAADSADETATAACTVVAGRLRWTP